MIYWEKFCSAAYWQQLVGNEFNRGYISAIICFFLIFLLLLLLKFILWLCFFRTRRCRSVEVTTDNGNVIVSRDAVTSLLRQELKEFPQLEVSSIRIMCRRKHYFLQLHALFRAGDQGLQTLLGDVRPRLLAALDEIFGISKITEIRVVVEEFSGEDEKDDGDKEIPHPPLVTIPPPNSF